MILLRAMLNAIFWKLRLAQLTMFPRKWLLRASQAAQQEESAWQAGAWVPSLGWEDPLEKDMQRTLLFFPGLAQATKSLEGYIPRACKSQTRPSG